MKSADYEKIKKVIGDIYEEHSDIMSSVPLDIFKVAQRMGFRIIKASQRISANHQKAIEFQNINKDNEIFGFSFYDTKKQEYVIYVDDVNAKTNKQRFSVAHEIGHIALGHVDKDQNTQQAENEADYFAGYILCPDCIGTNEHILNKIHENQMLLTKTFGIAEDTAVIKYRHICNRSNLSEKRYYEYEKAILECIEDSVLSKIRKQLETYQSL